MVRRSNCGLKWWKRCFYLVSVSSFSSQMNNRLIYCGAGVTVLSWPLSSLRVLLTPWYKRQQAICNPSWNIRNCLYFTFLDDFKFISFISLQRYESTLWFMQQRFYCDSQSWRFSLDSYLLSYSCSRPWVWVRVTAGAARRSYPFNQHTIDGPGARTVLWKRWTTKLQGWKTVFLNFTLLLHKTVFLIFLILYFISFISKNKNAAKPAGHQRPTHPYQCRR